MTRVLWVSNETPDQQGQGGQRRQFFQIRELARDGHAVTLCSLAGDQHDSGLRQHADVVRTRTHWGGRFPLLAHRRLLRGLAAQDWGAVVMAHTESWPTFGGLVGAVQAPSWVDLHNVLGKDIDGRGTKWGGVEQVICARATTVSVCSELERTRLLGQQPDTAAQVAVMTHGIDPHEWQARRSPSERPIVKLFGNWGWDPNRRGLEWFLDRVWSRVQETGARCEVAGSGAVIPSKFEASVTFVGRVPSLDIWTRDAWAVVVPVLGGIGAPVKYLEALATSAPVLSTPDGAPMAEDAAQLISSDPDEWARTLTELVTGRVAPPDSGFSLDEFDWRRATHPLLTWLQRA